VTILLATRNPGKISEARWIFQPTGLKVISLTDLNSDVEFQETKSSYYDNARGKAWAAFARHKMLTLAEDSGLEIDALNGRPGVISARFFSPGLTYYERNRRILEMLITVPAAERTARFRCVACLITAAGEEKIFEGICEGRIAHTIRGSYGFGYDPIFIPEGYGLTFAELGQKIKNQVSHRAKAFQQVAEFLLGVSESSGQIIQG
jgi:XTP/dITP diphosphohydrolase